VANGGEIKPIGQKDAAACPISRTDANWTRNPLDKKYKLVQPLQIQLPRSLLQLCTRTKRARNYKLPVGMNLVNVLTNF
jgi:Cu2+-containing amine oxidase